MKRYNGVARISALLVLALSTALPLSAVPVTAAPSKEATSKVTQSPSDKPFKLQPIEEKILKETNAQRARYGLPALKMDPKLVQSARDQASWMCSTGNFSHTNKMVGENIALGQQTAKEALNDWMNSSGHRANILSHEYSRIGVAAYQLGENGEIYWCQQFLR